MKRFFALILALIMLALPTASLAESYVIPLSRFQSQLEMQLERLLNSSDPAYTLTLSDPDGNAIVSGIGKTADGVATAYTMSPEVSLFVNELALILADETGVSAVSTEALLTALLAASQLPELSDEDLNALMTAGFDLLTTLMNSGAISFSMLGSMVNLHVDVDAFFRTLHMAVPLVLNRHAANLNPLLDKVCTYLFGAPLTCADLASLWAEIGLNVVQTGVTADLSVQLGNNIIVMGDIMGCSINAQYSAANGLQFSLRPAGSSASLVFRTADFITLGNILAAIPTVERENIDWDVTITRISITGERIAQVLEENAPVLNRLIADYTPWLQLIDPSVPVLTVQDVNEAAAWEQLGSLLDLTITANDVTESVKAEGHLGTAALRFSLCEGYSNMTWHAMLDAPNRYDPLLLTLSGVTEHSGSTYTLYSSQAILGAHTITLRQDTRYPQNTPFAITTDTDSFHFIARQDEDAAQRVDIKAGPLALCFSMVDDLVTASLTAPEFYANLSTNANRVSLDTSYFGLDYTETHGAVSIEGYVSDGWWDMSAFSFLLDENAEICTFSIQDCDGENIHVTYRDGELTLQAEGDPVQFLRKQEGRYLMTANGEPVLTILFEQDITAQGVAFQVRLVQGDATEGPAYVLRLAFYSDPVQLPENAVEVSPEEFLQKLMELF